jgi:hypothetical protein
MRAGGEQKATSIPNRKEGYAVIMKEVGPSAAFASSLYEIDMVRRSILTTFRISQGHGDGGEAFFQGPAYLLSNLDSA